MRHLAEEADSIITKQVAEEKSPSKVDTIAIGVATGVAATVIVQTGGGIINTLAKNPLVTFGAGIIAGYFTHKYRKEIIALSNHSAEHGKDFMLRQKQDFKNMLAVSQQASKTSPAVVSDDQEK
ncbi:MAG: hypothetical protein PHR16_01420 [Methylovulum sp.]|nr:hypothetical protein [Methylovulum sp.]